MRCYGRGKAEESAVEATLLAWRDQQGLGMTVEDREQTDSYSGVAGPIFLGAGAVVVGMLGVFWVGLAGLVWRPWEFGSTYHWDDEGPFTRPLLRGD